jgi:hypothetical protein
MKDRPSYNTRKLMRIRSENDDYKSEKYALQLITPSYFRDPTPLNKRLEKVTINP